MNILEKQDDLKLIIKAFTLGKQRNKNNLSQVEEKQVEEKKQVQESMKFKILTNPNASSLKISVKLINKLG